MKAFEQYWDRREKEMRPNVSHYYSALGGWKAALKWVNTMKQDNIIHNADIKIWDEIEQELKEN